MDRENHTGLVNALRLEIAGSGRCGPRKSIGGCAAVRPGPSRDDTRLTRFGAAAISAARDRVNTKTKIARARAGMGTT